MNVPLTLAIALLLLLFGAVFSGLNIGLMMVRPAELKRKADHGDRIAAQLYHYRKDGTYLIVCVLLGNVAVISTLTLLLESISTAKSSASQPESLTCQSIRIIFPKSVPRLFVLASMSRSSRAATWSSYTNPAPPVNFTDAFFFAIIL